MSFEPPTGQSSNRHVLVIDPDSATVEGLTCAVTGSGMVLARCQSLEQARARLQSSQFDLLVLELDLPGGDGLDLLREIRERSDTPVIVVTARKGKIAPILSLELGADDFVTKPADSDVLVARIRAVLRRNGRAYAPVPGLQEAAQTLLADTVSFDGWRFDTAGLGLWSPRGLPVHIPSTEAALLTVFVRNPRKPLSRAEIARRLRGDEDSCDERSIDVLVKKVRARIAGHSPNLVAIRTVRGVGYLFTPDVIPAS